MKILAVKLRAIGDTVLWTPALKRLREAFPEAQIHTLTYAANAAILSGNPDIDEQHYLKSKSSMELAKTLWALRAQKFDLFLGFHATTSLCRWAWLTGGKQTVLHHHSWPYTPRGSLPVPHAGELEDVITRDMRVLEAAGIDGGSRETKIYLSKAESEAAEAKMRAEILAKDGNPDLPRYLFLPGGSYSLKRYPKGQWLPMAAEMRERGKFQPVVVADKSLSTELGLRADCNRLKIPLFDNNSLREAIALISKGDRAFSNDSAPGHIAVALGVRTGFAFGPGCIGDFHPYDRTQHPLYRIDVTCRSQGPRDRDAFQYCTVTACAHHRCMRGLHVDLSAK